MPRSYATSSTGSGGGTPAGSNTQIQFNNSGNFGASANFVWSGTSLNLGVAGSAKGVLNLAGNTSGVVTVQPAAVAGTWSLTLPTTGGTNGYFLQTNGSGVTTWATGATPGGTDGDIQFKSGLSFLGVDYLYWDDTNLLLGIQTSAKNPLAAGHFISANLVTTGTIGTITGGTSVESLIGSPSGDTVTQAAPLTVGSYNGIASQVTGSGNYIANGSTYQLIAINYFSGGTPFNTYYQTAVSAIGTFTDDNSGNPFSIAFSWNATPTGGGYAGTLLFLGLNGSPISGTGYYDAGNLGATGSILDDGSGSPYNWGISGFPGTQSPDFVANNVTYTYDVYGAGVSPSGHNYYVLGDSPSFTDNNDGFPFALSLNNPNGFQVKFHETSAVFDKIIPTGMFIQYTNTVSDSNATTPTSYGYAPDGTGMTPNYYRVTPYGSINGNLFFGTPSAFSSPNFDDPFVPWFSTVSWSGTTNTTGYMIEYSTDGATNGITKHFDNGNSTTFSDDNLTLWTGGAATLTPLGYLFPALIAAKDTASITDVPTSIIQSLNVTTPSPWIDFQDSSAGSLMQFGYDHSNTGGFVKSHDFKITFGSGLGSSVECTATDNFTASVGGIVNLSGNGGIALGSNAAIDFTVNGLSGHQFVLNALNGIKIQTSLIFPYVAKTGTYTLTIGDYTVDCTANTFTTTLPQIGSNDAPVGRVFVVKNSGAGVITVATTGGDTIDGAATQTLVAKQSIMVQAASANWAIISNV